MKVGSRHPKAVCVRRDHNICDSVRICDSSVLWGSIRRSRSSVCSTPVPSLRQLIKSWEICLLSDNSRYTGFWSKLPYCHVPFIVPSFLSWGCDISAFSTYTVQNPKLFISCVLLDWLPYLAQRSVNVTVQLVDESTMWGHSALEYVHKNEELSPRFVCFHRRHPLPLLMPWERREGQQHEQNCAERHWTPKSPLGLQPSIWISSSCLTLQFSWK